MGDGRLPAMQDVGLDDEWDNFFLKGQLWLSRSSQDCFYCPELRGWGFKFGYQFLGDSFNQPGKPELYCNVDQGDWIVPKWQPDGHGGWDIPNTDGWTSVTAIHNGQFQEGWVPHEWCEESRKLQVPVTYAALDLGYNDCPLPDMEPWWRGILPYRDCHATIGYLPLLDDESMLQAMRKGNQIAAKFWEDGELPLYSFRPTVHPDGRVEGLCHYRVAALARRMRGGIFNAFPNIMAGQVQQKAKHDHLRAVFGSIHAQEGSPVIGVLLPGCDVYNLVQHMRHFLEYEIFGQLGRPYAHERSSRWVTPHITLSDPLRRGTERLPTLR